MIAVQQHQFGQAKGVIDFAAASAASFRRQCPDLPGQIAEEDLSEVFRRCECTGERVLIGLVLVQNVVIVIGKYDYI